MANKTKSKTMRLLTARQEEALVLGVYVLFEAAAKHPPRLPSSETVYMLLGARYLLYYALESVKPCVRTKWLR